MACCEATSYTSFRRFARLVLRGMRGGLIIFRSFACAIYGVTRHLARILVFDFLLEHISFWRVKNSFLLFSLSGYHGVVRLRTLAHYLISRTNFQIIILRLLMLESLWDGRVLVHRME